MEQDRIDEHFRKPYISLPGATHGIPNLKDILSSVPKEREHRFESAGEFIRRLADRVVKWRDSLPEGETPVVLTFLQTGDVVEVMTIGEDGHSGVVIEGMVGDSPCMFISHQASLQILCYTRTIEEEKPRRTIGFHVGGETIEA
ncbi:hypothetical protein SAMN02745181_2444 [Rubritalea squalenifaciens DSM 18772]|uniref:Uncharacterized protein n=2 Tax=Rubritalea TaxID=361050 RepID=A0A1M6LMH0_9BACT|nr:hypothetical protein [Rubritalea squalenifaciens]SHJ72431.1 hypothetical protein SAMN02745181_2444 [Rubritalea squalenifaciens DSM 18772]